MLEWIFLSIFFSDKKTKVVQEVTMFQHITWPDFGIPKDLFSIFELIHVVSQINSNCILVHCSAGVGRTGVFFALAKLIETFHSDAHCLNIFQTVLELRKSRKFMVNNEFIGCFHQSQIPNLQLFNDYLLQFMFQLVLFNCSSWKKFTGKIDENISWIG